MDKIELEKGKRMPQTPEQFARMSEKYEKALLREKEENSRLRAKFNKLDQKYLKARKEQREKDATLAENICHGIPVCGIENWEIAGIIAKAIRDS